MLKEIPDSSAAIKDIPTTPPSMILLGTKNKSNPIVYIKAPRVIITQRIIRFDQLRIEVSFVMIISFSV